MMATKNLSVFCVSFVDTEHTRTACTHESVALTHTHTFLFFCLNLLTECKGMHVTLQPENEAALLFLYLAKNLHHLHPNLCF